MKCVEKVPTFDCMKWDGWFDGGSHRWFKKRFASAAVFSGTHELTVSWLDPEKKTFRDFSLAIGDWMVINDLTGVPEAMSPAAWRRRFEPVVKAAESAPAVEGVPYL
jgi:hypothetical protein